MAFDQRKGGKPPKFIKGGGFGGALTLTPDATEDEKYMAQRWGASMLIFGDVDKPGVVHMLRPRSERVKRFNLFDRSPSVFLELAQAATDEALIAFTKGDNDGFFESVKRFADRYGLLENYADGLFGSKVSRWAPPILEMRRALIAWDKAERAGDWSQLIRILERAGEEQHRQPGVKAKVFLKKDPITASARLCIRPTDLLEALWIQLALAIDGNLNLRACIECRSWFTLEAGRGRSDKLYCSDACRMRAYRKRKGMH